MMCNNIDNPARGLIFGHDRNFSLYYHAQTGFGAHSVLYPMGPGDETAGE
jgi:hypothetical protein